MKNIAFLVALSFTLVGCEDRYRYPCQDPENKNNPECTRPQCEVDGFCYDKLNGIEEQVVVVEQAPCNSETEIVEETTGE